MAEAVDPNAASVQVAVRVRPMSERELKGNTLPVVTASSDKKEVTLIRGAGNRQQRQTYSFDAVFSDYSSQRDVFQPVRPLVDDVLNGYEGTVRASGNRPPLLLPPCVGQHRVRRQRSAGVRLRVCVCVCVCVCARARAEAAA